MGHPWGLWGQDLSHTSTKKFLTSISGYLESIYTPWTSELYGTYKNLKMTPGLRNILLFAMFLEGVL